jgi:Protein of unknown function (DUF3667)
MPHPFVTTFPISEPLEVTPAGEHAPRGGCTNCGSETVGKFCADCGERQPDHHHLTMGHFAHEAAHELVHLDGKLFHTLRLLVTRPGQLTADHFGGRRTRHIGPIRLFIVIFALQALLYSLSPRTAMFDIANAEKARPDVTASLEKIARHAKITLPELRQQLNARWAKTYKMLELLQIVFTAAVLHLLYRRRYFAEHMVFTTHFLAFLYLYLIVAYPVRLQVGIYGSGGASIANWIGGAILTVYMALALRRFYHDGAKLPWVRAIAGYGGVMIAFAALQMVTIGTALALIL